MQNFLLNLARSKQFHHLQIERLFRVGLAVEAASPYWSQWSELGFLVKDIKAASVIAFSHVRQTANRVAHLTAHQTGFLVMLATTLVNLCTC